MADGGERSRYIRHVRAIGVVQWRPLDHDDRQAEPSRRFDLAITGTAARILGNNSLDAVFFQHANFVIQHKGTARGHIAGIRHLQRRLHRIDTADDIAMLRGSFEGKKLLPSQCQKHTFAFIAERGNSLPDGIDTLPPVTRLVLPGGARKRYERNSGKLCRLDGVGGNPCGIGMGGIHENIEALEANEICKTRRTAKPAAAHRHWLFHWRKRTPGHGEQDSVAGVLCQLAGQNAGIRRAAKDEYGACHDV